jgi:hypothetical protein
MIKNEENLESLAYNPNHIFCACDGWDLLHEDAFSVTLSNVQCNPPLR